MFVDKFNFKVHFNESIENVNKKVNYFNIIRNNFIINNKITLTKILIIEKYSFMTIK